MSLADEFILVRQDGTPLREPRFCVGSDQSITGEVRFGNLLNGLRDGDDFGPFMAIKEVSDDRLAEHRWLRVAVLLSQIRVAEREILSGFSWLDEPNESLDNISPFEATGDDESFARACALVLLMGGSPIEPNTREESLFRDFCELGRPIAERFGSHRDTLLVITFSALHAKTRSAFISRWLLTCRVIDLHEEVTLYRLIRSAEHEKVAQVLGDQFNTLRGPR